MKIWTTLTNKIEFLSLSALNRGIYLQLLLWCKGRDDSGTIVVQNKNALGALLGCDGKTAWKSLGILQENSLLKYHTDPVLNDNSDQVGQIQRKSPGNFPPENIKKRITSIVITLPKYRYWQDIDTKRVVAKSRKSPGKIPPLRPDQTKPEQTRAEQTIPKVEESAKPKQSNIEEFDEWWAANNDRIKEMILAVMGQGKEEWTGWHWRWAQKHKAEMRSWFIADPTRRKKKYGVFVRHWLTKAWKDHLTAGDGPGMTVAEERAHEASKHRSGGGSDAVPIGRIIDNIIAGAKK